MKDKETSDGTLERLIREPELQHLTGVPKVSWWEMERKGRAPRRVHIGQRTVAGKITDLQLWIETVAKGRDWSDATN